MRAILLASKHFCLAAAWALLSAELAFSATATMTATPNGGNFDYTITLNNGPIGKIETFWFGWIPGLDFLSSQPTVTGSPDNWTSFVEAGAQGGYSIEWFDTGTSSPITSGQSSSAFKFTSAETPTEMQGLDHILGYYQQTFSYVYQGAAEVSPGSTITNIPITVVPEPASLVLAGSGLLAIGLLWKRRKADTRTACP